MAYDTLPRWVTTVPQVSPTERVALAGLTGVLMLAAVGALLTLPPTHRSGTDRSAARALASPAAERVAAPIAGGLPVHKDGRVLTRFADAGYLGVVMDSTRANVLHVVVAHGTRTVDCNVIDPVVMITEQNATAVRLVVTGYQYVPPASSGAGGTTCVTAGSQSVPVTLAAPLGDRRVYAGSSPESTTLADPADLPVPTELPQGYHVHSTSPVSATARTLVGERSYRRGDDLLVVRVGSRYDVLAEGNQSADTTVDGHFAVVTDSSSGRCVTWTELSGRVRQVCSSGEEPLAADDLLTVARSLH